MARYLGLCSVGAYCDLKKLFDTVNPCRLAGLAVKMCYPLFLLYLGIVLHEAPRILEVQGFCSDLIPTGMGVLPGCGQSMPWIKI
eukprot:7322959-Pyramimonas_sp.AAC.1